MDARKVSQFDGHTGAIYTLEHAREPHLFYSGSDDRILVEWNLAHPPENRAIAKLPEKAFALKYIPKKQLLLAGNYTGGIHVIDLVQHKEIKLLQLHRTIIFDIQYFPEKEWFFVLAGDGTYSVWTIDGFNLVTNRRLGNYKLRSIDFSEQRNEAAIGCGDGTVHIIDMDTFEEKWILKGHMEGFSVNAVKYHPNGTFLLSGSRDAHLNLWDVDNSYKLTHRIPAHNYAIYSIAFSPDGNLFATSSMDKTVKIWDAKELELLLRISPGIHDGHTNSVNKLMWSNYHNYLLSTGDDRTIKVWEIFEKRSMPPPLE
ncbi:MAG: WD40 repeat domain-containing protein [Flavobacteriales bacterium]|nr:WD40 repeat domain-containing protein [Flavobacteriales bacterium]